MGYTLQHLRGCTPQTLCCFTFTFLETPFQFFFLHVHSCHQEQSDKNWHQWVPNLHEDLLAVGRAKSTASFCVSCWRERESSLDPSNSNSQELFQPANFHYTWVRKFLIKNSFNKRDTLVGGCHAPPLHLSWHKSRKYRSGRGSKICSCIVNWGYSGVLFALAIFVNNKMLVIP